MTGADENVLQEIFQQLQSDTPEIQGIALVSSDGMIMDHYWRSGIEPDKVGAMGAALLGLGKKAIQVLSNGEFLQVVIQSSGGMLGVYGCGERAVLIANMSKEGNLGQLNLYCRRAAARIAEVIKQ